MEKEANNLKKRKDRHTGEFGGSGDGGKGMEKSF